MSDDNNERFKKVPCKRMQQANRYSLASNDMLETVDYLKAYFELDEIQKNRGTTEYYDHLQGLLIAAIVVYSRSFFDSHSDGYAADKIGVKKKQLSSPTLFDLHNKIVFEIRGRIAHSRWEVHKTELIEVYDSGATLRRRPIPQYFKDLDIEAFFELAKQLAGVFKTIAFEIDTKTEL